MPHGRQGRRKCEKRIISGSHTRENDRILSGRFWRTSLCGRKIGDVPDGQSRQNGRYTRHLRTSGIRDVEAIREETGLPVIGLVKIRYEGYESYITPTMKEVDVLLGAVFWSSPAFWKRSGAGAG